MGKTNTRASATQIEQDVAAQEAAAAEAAAAAEKAALLEGSQEKQVDGTQEKSSGDTTTPASDAQSSSVGDNTAEKDIIIEPVAAPTPAPAEQPKTVVVESPKPVAANAPLVDQLANILKDVPPAHQIEINRILAYLERMAPKSPIDPKAGIAQQVALYRSIQTIINRQEQYFTQLFTALLFIFKSEAKGCLSDRYRMRFMDNITLAEGDRKAFANITQMLAILADPKSREVAMKQINMERALENGLTIEGRTRVLNYFNI